MPAYADHEAAAPKGDEQRGKDSPWEECRSKRQDKGQRRTPAPHERLARIGERIFVADAGQPAVADIVECDAGPGDACLALAAALALIANLAAKLVDLCEQFGALALVESASLQPLLQASDFGFGSCAPLLRGKDFGADIFARDAGIGKDAFRLFDAFDRASPELASDARLEFELRLRFDELFVA